MRYLMYGRCYGELEKAKSTFKDLSLIDPRRMANMDYREAEQKCLQGLHIGRHM